MVRNDRPAMPAVATMGTFEMGGGKRSRSPFPLIFTPAPGFPQSIQPGKESQEFPGDGSGDSGNRTGPGCAACKRSLTTAAVPTRRVGSTRPHGAAIPSGC